MPKRPLSQRLYSEPALTELVRVIGYDGVTIPLAKDVTERLHSAFGVENISAAAEELVEYDTERKVANLKANVRKLAFGLLGPAPEDYHWACPDKLAVVPSPTINEDTEPEPTIDEVAEAIANAVEEETGLRAEVIPCEPPSRAPTRYVAPPELTPEQMVRTLRDTELLGLIEDAKWAITHYGRSRKATPFKRDLRLGEAERERRGLSPRPDPDVERFRNATHQELKDLLDLAKFEVGTYSTTTVTHEEAVRHISLIQQEMRRRSGALEESLTPYKDAKKGVA